MKDAVWSAVSFCNYDNVEKKYRLCHAILDVMIGQKTLKSAAHNNNVGLFLLKFQLFCFFLDSVHYITNILSSFKNHFGKVHGK